MLGRIISLLLMLSASAAVLATPADHLSRAVQFQTISAQEPGEVDYAQFAQLHRFLRVTYPQVFEQFEVEVINDYSLFMRWHGSDAAIDPILFTAHMDVVPVEPGTEAAWEHPPFAGVVADGKIYGRGTLDDKVGMIGLLEAAELLLTEGFKPRRTIAFGFGHDEEIGGVQGAGAIASRMQQLGMQFEWMVDEGGLLLMDNPLVPGRPLAMINVAEKGYLTLTLVARGEGGHSSRPPKISTIGRLSQALARIEQHPFEPRLVAPVRAMLEIIAPLSPQPRRLVLENLWLTDGLVASGMADDSLTSSFVRTTTALTMFNAGVKENVLPQRAEARVNFRLLPGDTPEMVAAYIEQVVDDPTVEISYERWNNVPPTADHEAAGFAVIAGATAALYPEAVVVPSLLMATTDTRHYIDLVADQYRFHGVAMLASQASSIHGTNEFVSVDSFEKSIAVAQRMMRLGAQ